jgi:hypothetical protein
MENKKKSFFDEVRFMLANQMIAPNSPQWFNTGLNWAYGIDGPSQGHHYVDHVTGKLTKSASSYERPQPHACFIQGIDEACGYIVYVAGEEASTSLTSLFDGGNGGAVQIFGGKALGGHHFDDGGNIEMWGGHARGGEGGSIVLKTGYGFTTSSGRVSISTVNSGQAGVSGGINIFTGTTSLGNSGHFSVHTGQAHRGKGGTISMHVGEGDSSVGGDVIMQAGKTTDRYTGGFVDITSGYSVPTSSGHITMYHVYIRTVTLIMIQ